MQRAFDIDFALSAGVNITLNEIDAEEFRALKIIRTERSKFEREQIEKGRAKD
jgi:hypothetical protein